MEDKINTADSNLEIDHSVEEGKSILILSGDLDVKSAPKLRKFFESVISNGDVDLKVDLSKLSYLDSSGYGVLVDAGRRTRATKGSLHLTNTPSWVRDFFDLTFLDNT